MVGDIKRVPGALGSADREKLVRTSARTKICVRGNNGSSKSAAAWRRSPRCRTASSSRRSRPTGGTLTSIWRRGLDRWADERGHAGFGRGRSVLQRVFPRPGHLARQAFDRPRWQFPEPRLGLCDAAEGHHSRCWEWPSDSLAVLRRSHHCSANRGRQRAGALPGPDGARFPTLLGVLGRNLHVLGKLLIAPRVAAKPRGLEQTQTPRASPAPAHRIIRICALR